MPEFWHCKEIIPFNSNHTAVMMACAEKLLTSKIKSNKLELDDKQSQA